MYIYKCTHLSAFYMCMYDMCVYKHIIYIYTSLSLSLPLSRAYLYTTPKNIVFPVHKAKCQVYIQGFSIRLLGSGTFSSGLGFRVLGF